MPAAQPTLLVDTGSVRVTSWSFAPGASTGMHRHVLEYGRAGVGCSESPKLLSPGLGDA